MKNAINCLSTTAKSANTPGSDPFFPHLGWNGDNDLLYNIRHSSSCARREMGRQASWSSECGGGLADAESGSESEQPEVCKPPLNRSTEAALAEGG